MKRFVVGLLATIGLLAVAARGRRYGRGLAAAARAAGSARAGRADARFARRSRRGRGHRPAGRARPRGAADADRGDPGARTRRARPARQRAAGAAERRGAGPRADPGIARRAGRVPRAGQIRLRLCRQLRRVRSRDPRLLSRDRVRADPSAAGRLARAHRHPDRDAVSAPAVRQARHPAERRQARRVQDRRRHVPRGRAYAGEQGSARSRWPIRSTGRSSPGSATAARSSRRWSRA